MDLISILTELIEEGRKLEPQGGQLFTGYNGDLQPDYVAWRHQAIVAIEELGTQGKKMLHDIELDKNGPYFFQSSVQNVLGALKAALAIAKWQPTKSAVQRPASFAQSETKGEPDKVFLVHGHDRSLLEQVARYLGRFSLDIVILFEKPGRGKTIIEKLEIHSGVHFSIVLLTPDDVGKGANEEGEPRPRARQNVLLELGYFIGKLGRGSVAVLYSESVELPSDIHGVEYIKVDAAGAWKLTLARELKQAGLKIDMNNAI